LGIMECKGLFVAYADASSSRRRGFRQAGELFLVGRTLSTAVWQRASRRNWFGASPG